MKQEASEDETEIRCACQSADGLGVEERSLSAKDDTVSDQTDRTD